MTTALSTPRIVIVGRPNVGKSALFNRIVGRRIAIVHETPGVTRDRLESLGSWKGRAFTVVDTGGLTTLDGASPHSALEREVQEQVQLALEEASGVILVTDVTEGLVAMDQAVADRLRVLSCPVVVAANKADEPARDMWAAEFEALGFPVFPVSALHNRGVDRLLDAVTRALPPAEVAAAEEPLKIAVVGRPNVGKSSFINALLGARRLIVSPQPGTTRDSVDVTFVLGSRRYVLIDTAGVRKIRRVHEPVERFSLLRVEKSIRRAEVVALMLDATEGPRELDKKLAARIIEERRACVLVVNKWDLAKQVGRSEYAEALHRAIPHLDFVPIVFVSSVTRAGIEESLRAVEHVASQWRRRISTGLLNRVLHQAAERVQAPGHRDIKLFYAVQTDAAPPTFKIFVNDAQAVTQSYRAYLTNSLRSAFGFEGTPLVLHFTSRPRQKKAG